MIGLDIGTYSIKAVEFQKKDDALTLTNFKFMEKAFGEKESLAAVLKKFFKEGNFSGKETNISVSGQLVVARLLELPRMSDEEVKNAIKFEAEKYIPYSIEDAVLDYQVALNNPQAKNFSIFFAAVKNDFVSRYVEAVLQSGFIVKGVDVDGIALANSFFNAYPPNKDEEKAVALLNIGDAFVNTSITWQGIPFVIRDIKGAGNELADGLSKSLGLSQEEAHQLKTNTPSDKKESMSDAMRPVLNTLVKEINLSFGYFENQFGKEIGKVYISGGSANLFGLKEFLSEAFGIQVEGWDPFNSVKISENISPEILGSVKAALAIAVGLAIRND